MTGYENRTTGYNFILGKTLDFNPVFEIKVLFCAPLGCIHIETVRPGFSLSENVRPVAKMCAPGADCTVNFEHCNQYLCQINVPLNLIRYIAGYNTINVYLVPRLLNCTAVSKLYSYDTIKK